MNIPNHPRPCNTPHFYVRTPLDHGADRHPILSRLPTMIGIALILLTMVGAPLKAQSPIAFPDPALKQAILDQLGRATGPVTDLDVASLTTLSARNYGITNIGGLDAATNLTTLDLGNSGNFRRNLISDLDPLRGLLNKNLRTANFEGNLISDLSTFIPLIPSWKSKLTSLNLARNKISDPTLLAVHSDLTHLNLGGNMIESLNSLTDLQDLIDLDVSGNKISDLGPLSALTELRVLDIGTNCIRVPAGLFTLNKLEELRGDSNLITDTSFVQSLPLIRILSFEDNEISDITFVATLPALTDVNVAGNFLDLSAGSAQRATIDALASRPGVTVTFEPQKERLPANGLNLWAMGGSGLGSPNFYRDVGFIADGATAIAVDSGHALFVKTDRSLWGVGGNGSGELGDGTQDSRPFPIKITEDTRAVATGQSHSLFIKGDCSLWAMGRNASGQLGDGTLDQRIVPIQVATQVQSVASASRYSLFLKMDGSLWGMGDLPGSQFSEANPVQISEEVRSMSAGSNHILFVRDDGTLWGMGFNNYGQLGPNVPFPAGTGLITTGVKSAAAGTWHTLFVKEDGTLWSMGNNQAGQLGDGTKTLRTIPVQITSRVRAVAAGNWFSLILKEDGTLLGMGENNLGQLGEGVPYALGTSTPVEISQRVWRIGASPSSSFFLAENYRLTTAAVNGSVQSSPGRSFYSIETPVTLTPTPDFGYRFQSWSGDVPDGQMFTNPLPLTMDRDRSISANFQLNIYQLAVSSPNGTVIRNPNAGVYTHGDVIVLTASPNAGFLFSHWTGDVPTEDELTNPLSLTMDSNKSVTAVYIPTYTLATTANNGMITRSLPGPVYQQGTNVILTAVPDPGYHFVNWTGDIAGNSASFSPILLTMNRNRAVTAVFEINSYSLLIQATNGIVIRVPNLVSYDHGTPVTLTPVPAEGYRFQRWSGNVPAGAETTSPLPIVMDRERLLTAHFEDATYPLTIISDHGIVGKSPDQALYTHGMEVTLTVTADPDYHFRRWSGDVPVELRTANPVTLLMNQPRTVTALYQENLFTPGTTTLSRDWFMGNAPTGTMVGILTAPDLDVEDSITYALVAGPGDSDNSRFRIEGDELRTNGLFNDTLQESFRILVEARDLAGHATTTELVIRSIPSRPFATLHERDTFTTDPSWVSVLFEMRDQNGVGINYPRELIESQPDLFTVREDGGRLSPTESFRQIAKLDEVPYKLKTVLLLDNSFSVRNDLAQIKAAAKVAVDHMFPGQEIAIYSFSELPTLEQDFTDDPALLNAAIDGIDLGFPTTNLYGSIITTLNRWTEVFDVNGFSHLTPADILQLSSLTAKLAAPADPVSQYLKTQLSANTRQLVDEFVPTVSDPIPLREALVVDLNGIIDGPNIHDPQRFAGIALRPETQLLIDVSPRGDDLVELNRLLLEDAFPADLARKRPNAIETGYLVVLTDGSDQAGLATLPQVLAKRNLENKRIFTVGLGQEIDPSILTQIANVGSLGFRNVLEAEALGDAFRDIQEDIRNAANSFYWLNYASPKRGNFSRTLTVSLNGNRNTLTDSVLTTQFSSNGFSSVRPGLVVNRSGFRPNGIGFLNVDSLEAHPLRAFTILAFDPPQYTWEVGNTDLFDLIPSDLDPARVDIVPKLNGVTEVTVTDTVNGYETIISIRIDVDELDGRVVMILESPGDLRVVEGGSATMAGLVNENVTGVVSWEFRIPGDDWTVVAGANAPTLTIQQVRREHAGEYRLVYTYNTHSAPNGRSFSV
jgi:hypothetical protein